MGKTLSTLKPPQGARRARRRLGRGPGSGLGKTSGKGQKGQLSRSGHDVRRGFEGGQMPMQRRLPKRGFKNLFRKAYAPVNVGALGARFGQGDTVEPQGMKAAGLMPRSAECVKILGDGEVTHKLTVKAHAFSKEARKKIEAAGGAVQVIEDPRRKGSRATTSKGSGTKGKAVKKGD